MPDSDGGWAVSHAARMPGVGRHFEEGEAPPQRLIDQGHRAVGGVHRAEQVQVRRQPERAARVRQRHCLVAVLQQVEQLAEDARQVAAVDLVDDQDVRLRTAGVPPRPRRRTAGRPRPGRSRRAGRPPRRIGPLCPRQTPHSCRPGGTARGGPRRRGRRSAVGPGSGRRASCRCRARLAGSAAVSVEQAARPPQPVVAEECRPAEVGVGEAIAPGRHPTGRRGTAAASASTVQAYSGSRRSKVSRISPTSSSPASSGESAGRARRGLERTARRPRCAGRRPTKRW